MSQVNVLNLTSELKHWLALWHCGRVLPRLPLCRLQATMRKVRLKISMKSDGMESCLSTPKAACTSCRLRFSQSSLCWFWMVLDVFHRVARFHRLMLRSTLAAQSFAETFTLTGQALADCVKQSRGCHMPPFRHVKSLPDHVPVAHSRDPRDVSGFVTLCVMTKRIVFPSARVGLLALARTASARLNKQGLSVAKVLGLLSEVAEV